MPASQKDLLEDSKQTMKLAAHKYWKACIQYGFLSSFPGCSINRMYLTYVEMRYSGLLFHILGCGSVGRISIRPSNVSTYVKLAIVCHTGTWSIEGPVECLVDYAKIVGGLKKLEAILRSIGDVFDYNSYEKHNQVEEMSRKGLIFFKDMPDLKVNMEGFEQRKAIE